MASPPPVGTTSAGDSLPSLERRRYQRGALRRERKRWILRLRVDGPAAGTPGGSPGEPHSDVPPARGRRREKRIVIGTVADLPTRALARRAADALLPQLNPTRARSAEGMTLGGFAPIYLTDSVSMMKADRKSTRLNSSHRTISYAVFCLKKKKKTNK